MIIRAFRALDLLWLRIKTSFEHKPFEWFFALVTMAWGFSLAQPTPTFSVSPSYRIFAVLMEESTWTLVCFWGGLARIVILTINGSWFRSAFFRTLASASCLALWLAASLAFTLSGTATPGGPIYALFFVVEFQCMINAGYEAGRSETAEWARVTAAGVQERYGRAAIVLLFLIGYTRGAKHYAARDS